MAGSAGYVKVCLGEMLLLILYRRPHIFVHQEHEHEPETSSVSFVLVRSAAKGYSGHTKGLEKIRFIPCVPVKNSAIV